MHGNVTTSRMVIPRMVSSVWSVLFSKSALRVYRMKSLYAVFLRIDQIDSSESQAIDNNNRGVGINNSHKFFTAPTKCKVYFRRNSLHRRLSVTIDSTVSCVIKFYEVSVWLRQLGVRFAVRTTDASINTRKYIFRCCAL